MRFSRFFVFLVPVCLFAQPGPKYTIQDLGTLTNFPSCSGTAISQSGEVTGYCTAAGGSVITGSATRPFLYANGTLKDLGQPPSQSAVPTGVNDSGLMVGAFAQVNLLTGISTQPFIYQNGSIQKLAGVPGDLAPLALNNAGQIAGTIVDANGSEIFRTSQALELASPTSPAMVLTAQGAAFGISSNGQWVSGADIGQAGGQITTIKPALWQNGAHQALPLDTSYTFTAAIGVNDSGTAAGYAFNYDFTTLLDLHAAAHAALFNNGAVSDLGVLPGDKSSVAIGINNSGDLVGFSSSLIPSVALHLVALLSAASANYHAYVYRNGVMYDLTRSLVNGAGWQLCFATAINNAGQIAGTGIFQQQQHAFLLTPAPVPLIGAVVGAGLSVPPVNSISGNGLFTIFGTSLAPAGTNRNVVGSDLTNNALPTNLANTCVQAGATRWPLIYVSDKQINAVADPASASGNVAVSVITNCGTPNETATAPVNVTLAAETPQFLFFVQNPNGQNEVVAVEALSGVNVGPPGLISTETFAPARAGDVLTAYGVGWGETDPAAMIGSLAPGAAKITGQYSLTVGGKTAVVSYAGLTPTYAGLYQINFTVPDGLAPGNQPIVLTVNGTPTPVGAFLAVQ